MCVSLPGAAAVRTRLLRLEVTQRSPRDLHHDALAVARGARADLGAGLDARAGAGTAGLEVPNPDLLLTTENGLLEVQLKVEPKVVSGHGPSPSSSPSASSSETSSGSGRPTGTTPAAEESVENVP